jgi:glycosyltransferase involved in cell wall biosynthesis
MVISKKKILIVSNNFATGGVQKALINLLNEIKDLYDITIYIFSNSGEYKNCIPEQVKIIEGSPFLRILGLSQEQVKEESYFLYFVRGLCILFTKLFSNHLPISILVKSQQKLSGFDVAISYLQTYKNKILGGGCNKFVLCRVAAKQKITFLHCDFLNYGGNTSLNRKIYQYFDKIAAVSEGCLHSFIKAIPSLKAKTYCVYNCHNFSEYISIAEDRPVEYVKDCLNIVTVARLSHDKGIPRTVKVINRIIKQGYKLRWHIVGEGIEKREIEKEINTCNLGEYIILHGNQENPYRFMKNADAFLLPSYNEAAPLVFGEAKCLGIPVITTNTSSAIEMVEEGKEGFVCENSEYGLYEILKKVVNNPEELSKCRDYLRKQQYTNEKALWQFRNLIEEID